MTRGGSQAAADVDYKPLGWRTRWRGRQLHDGLDGLAGDWARRLQCRQDGLGHPMWQ